MLQCSVESARAEFACESFVTPFGVPHSQNALSEPAGVCAVRHNLLQADPSTLARIRHNEFDLVKAVLRQQLKEVLQLEI